MQYIVSLWKTDHSLRGSCYHSTHLVDPKQEQRKQGFKWSISQQTPRGTHQSEIPTLLQCVLLKVSGMKRRLSQVSHSSDTRSVVCVVTEPPTWAEDFGFEIYLFPCFFFLAEVGCRHCPGQCRENIKGKCLTFLSKMLI